MGNKNNIHVEYLCNEPFWKFSKTGEHEYCKVCGHHIKDFTGLDRKSTIETIKQTGGETCGVFYEDQFVIDDKTKNGTTLFKVILASSLSAFVATNSNANIKEAHNIITEQGISSGLLQSDKIGDEDSTSQCVAYVKGEDDVNPIAKRKRHYLKIGKTRIYINARFPFLHIRKMRKGRIKQGY